MQTNPALHRDDCADRTVRREGAGQGTGSSRHPAADADIHIGFAPVRFDGPLAPLHRRDAEYDGRRLLRRSTGAGIAVADGQTETVRPADAGGAWAALRRERGTDIIRREGDDPTEDSDGSRRESSTESDDESRQKGILDNLDDAANKIQDGMKQGSPTGTPTTRKIPEEDSGGSGESGESEESKNDDEDDDDSDGPSVPSAAPAAKTAADTYLTHKKGTAGSTLHTAVVSEQAAQTISTDLLGKSVGQSTGGMAGGASTGIAEGIRGLTTMGAGAVQLHKASKLKKAAKQHGDTISTNAAEQLTEGGVWNTLFGGADTAAGTGSAVGAIQHLSTDSSSAVPIVGEIFNAGAAVMKGKTAIEDSTASARLDRQARKIRGELRQDPALHAAIGVDDKARGALLKQKAALGTLTAAEAEYLQMRNLRKVARFGQRRLGESGSVNAVDATGHAADLVGTFTAAGDFGATKATGKALKAGVGGYKSWKGLWRRGRQAVKLAEIRNTTGYKNTNKKRGKGWILKQTFNPSLQEKFEASADVVDKWNAPDEEAKARLVRKAQREVGRRVGDLFECLCSASDVVRKRAKKIVHIIAESTLAGAINSIDDADLDWFKQNPNDPDFKRRKGVLITMLKTRLAGFGG